MSRVITAGEGAADVRLDLFLARELDITRSRAQSLIKSGHVLVGSKPQRPGYVVSAGDTVVVDQPPAQAAPAPATVPDLRIVYQDDDLMVVDKPAGLPAHAGNGTAGQATVADFARQYTTDPDPERPGIVHRLDQDTSGLMIIAKTAAARAYLQDQFRRHEVAKTYQALVTGRPDHPEAVIRLPLSRDPAKPLRRAVVPGGREAVTHYRTLATYPGFTLLEAHPQTGRTHQLRVHFAATGHPIAGDTTYGPPRRPEGLGRQFLHASELKFVTPSGKSLTLTSPLPPGLAAFISALDKAV